MSMDAGSPQLARCAHFPRLDTRFQESVSWRSRHLQPPTAPPLGAAEGSGWGFQLHLPAGQAGLFFQNPGVWYSVSLTQLQPFALCPFLPAKAPYPMCLPRSARVSCLLYSSLMVVSFQSVCLPPEEPGTQRIYFPSEVSCPGHRRSLVALTI